MRGQQSQAPIDVRCGCPHPPTFLGEAHASFDTVIDWVFSCRSGAALIWYVGDEGVYTHACKVQGGRTLGFSLWF